MFQVIILLIIFGFIYIYVNKLHIDFGSFFKKGFKRLDNVFGVFCYCGKQGTGKTYSAVEFCDRIIKNKQVDIFITNLNSYYDELRKDKNRDRFKEW